MKTKIYCLEGITGAGKTALSKKIRGYLNRNNLEFLIVNEKEYNPFKQTIIDWHNNGANQEFSLDDVERIARARGEMHKLCLFPKLGSLDYLLFDRCLYTSGIYQMNNNLTPERIIEINLSYQAIKPEKGLVLICSPEIALDRTNLRRKERNDYRLPSMHETLKEIENRRELYLRLCQNHQELYLIDTSEKTIDQVFEIACEKLGL